MGIIVFAQTLADETWSNMTQAEIFKDKVMLGGSFTLANFLSSGSYNNRQLSQVWFLVVLTLFEAFTIMQTY